MYRNKIKTNYINYTHSKGYTNYQITLQSNLSEGLCLLKELLP